MFVTILTSVSYSFSSILIAAVQVPDLSQFKPPGARKPKMERNQKPAWGHFHTQGWQQAGDQGRNFQSKVWWWWKEQAKVSPDCSDTFVSSNKIFEKKDIVVVDVWYERYPTWRNNNETWITKGLLFWQGILPIPHLNPFQFFLTFLIDKDIKIFFIFIKKSNFEIWNWYFKFENSRKVGAEQPPHPFSKRILDTSYRRLY